MRPDHETRLRATHAARRQYLERGAERAAGVRDLVAASWRRSRLAGVDSDAYRIAYHPDVDVDSRLMRCARPVVDRLADEMVDVPVAIALSDAQARIVHRRDCSTVVGRPLDRVDFNAGFSFAEGGIGTNGIGTVFETGASVTVVGAEHFTEALVAFACTGAPVHDPATGRVEGVLDVSSLAEDWTPLMQTLVRRAAHDIGRNLLLDRGTARQALFEAFARADSRPRQAVMAAGETLMLNRRAQELYSPAEQVAIHQHARFVGARGRRVATSLALDSGRVVRLRVTPVVVGEDVAGLVLLLDDEPAGGGGAVAAPAGAGAVPAPGRRARDRRPVTVPMPVPLPVRAGPVLVLGEPGTGRCRAVTEPFRREFPDGLVVTVRAADPAPRLPEPDPAAPGPLLVVLRDLDRLGAPDVASWSAVLPGLTRAGVRLAGTVDAAAIGGGAPFERLLPLFAESVTLPPLRYRAEDVPREAGRLLAELVPGRQVRLRADTARALGRFDWPGNLPQLREALQLALRRRPVGQLRPEDLPAWCRTTGTRRLTAIERAERDAIVDVLQQCGGNRVRAAARLGLSRSTLYRKIAGYRITGE